MASFPTLESRGDRRYGRVADRSGLALVATLLVLAVMGVLVTAAVRAALSSARTAGLEYHEARAFYAAEAGVEAALAQLKIALQDGLLEDEELADIGPPDLEGFSYDSFSVERRGQSVVEPITDGPFAGLYALTQNVEVHSQAEDRAGTVSGVVLEAKAQAIPIFQFGVFFEEDLEATNGPPMEFVGRVHSNGNIYLSSRNAWYRDMVTTPSKVFHDRKDRPLIYDGVYINDAEANEVQLDFDSRTIPGAEQFKAESCDKFDCRLQTDAFEVDTLQLPLPDGVPAYELVRAREEADSDSEREAKFAWNADMYVTVDLTDMRTKGEVCGAAGTPPDETEGEITITALGPVYPGAGWVTFRASHPALGCEDFDGRADLNVDADEWEYEGGMETCTFQVHIGSDAEEVEIEIELEGEDYAELDDDVEGMAKWDIEGRSGDSGDSMPWPNIQVERPLGGEAPSRAEVCTILQWRWSAFYDGREEELKDVLDIDISELGAWVGTSESRRTDIIYLEFVLPESVRGYSQEVLDQMLDATLDPAIRVRQGRRLPNGLTLASEWPLYVYGDYNSVEKQPASLAADGVTILSNGWSDGSNRPGDEDFDRCEGLVSDGNPCTRYEGWADGWRYYRAAETTVNAAILAGHWPTPCDHYEPTCPYPGTSADWYGGGIENFPRFLEEWTYADGSKVIFHYLGALVSPFTSRKTTGTWNGSYYVPPQRDWWFDTDFRDPALLPPGTPNVGKVIRTAMREAF